ncbi:MAG: efflux RND transporter permease subunit, partial [Spirochaetales bacterium]|nr:efflux RND transporter permease subunit [Spirochaetales bacterium]
MRTLVRKAAEHPVSVLMVYASLCTLGVISFLRLDWELLPTLSTPVARVITEYPGIPAPEVEELITIPLENALASVRGVREISSVSKDELSAVSLRFDWGVDPGRAADQAREAVDSVYPYLPFGARKPLVFTEDSQDPPVLAVAVVPVQGRRLEEISRAVRGELATLLRQAPGVASVRLVGLSEPELQVEVDAGRLEAASLSLEAVAAAVATSVYELPLGTVVENGLEYLVKASTGVRTPESLRGIPLAVATAGNPGGVPGRYSGLAAARGEGRGGSSAVSAFVTLGEVAAVRMGVKERTSFFHWNGREAIGIFFYKSGGTGSLNAARA